MHKYTEILQGLFSKTGRDDAFAKLLEKILNQVLQAQASEQLQAGPKLVLVATGVNEDGYREILLGLYSRPQQ